MASPEALTLPFYAAVALAGSAFLASEELTSRIGILRHFHIPEPLLGGLIMAGGLSLLRPLGWAVEIPHSGTSVDFLIALLTTNMGLHLTPKVLRQGWPLFILFLAGGTVLYGIHLLVVLPIALLGETPLATAVITGPLAYVGAPYNLNPPAQVPPVADLLTPPYHQAEATAQGMMMIGVLASPLLVAWVGHRLFERAGKEATGSRPSARETPSVPISNFAGRETHLIVLILALVALAFGLQALLFRMFPGLASDHIPVIVLGYLLGGAVRFAVERLAGSRQFPEAALTVLLLGPTMSIVLTYAIGSAPLHLLARITPAMAAAGGLAVVTSAAMAWLMFPLFVRFAGRYYAAVIATAFLGVTTGWGPVGMSYLRRFTDQSGPVEPMPAILPLNAFYLFPWTAILLTRLVFGLFG